MRMEPSELPAPESLPQRVVGRALGVPVDRIRIDLLARAVEDADLLARQVARIALHVRNDFLLDDRGRHRPGRIEVYDLDAGGDLGRGMFGIAHDRDIAMNDPVVFDRLNRSRRQIDDDVALSEREIEPGETVGAGRKLFEPHAGGNVHRLQSGAGDDPGLSEAHARLEALDRCRQVGVPGLTARMNGLEIALDREALAQLRHLGPLCARMLRHDVGRPAAGVGYGRVAFGGFRRGEERVGQQCRLGVGRERGFERGRGRGDLLHFCRGGRCDRGCGVATGAAVAAGAPLAAGPPGAALAPSHRSATA